MWCSCSVVLYIRLSLVDIHAMHQPYHVDARQNYHEWLVQLCSLVHTRLLKDPLVLCAAWHIAWVGVVAPLSGAELCCTYRGQLFKALLGKCILYSWCLLCRRSFRSTQRDPLLCAVIWVSNKCDGGRFVDENPKHGPHANKLFPETKWACVWHPMPKHLPRAQKTAVITNVAR